MKGARYHFDGTFIITKVVHEFAFDGLWDYVQVKYSKALTASEDEFMKRILSVIDIGCTPTDVV